MIFLTFLTAMALSGVAAYYSVIGLAAIFPGSFWPIIIMGTVLEASKLVTVSWLYRNWKVVHIGMKSYLTVATVILMLITSMGIFGYLSKAHLEHSSDTAPMASKVQLIDEKIKVVKENLDANRKVIKQMDEMVDQTMGRSNDEKGIANSVVIRRNQQKERSRIQAENETYQKTISQLTEEKFPLQIELQKAESDFGPIKYVAELIYGSGEKDIIDKAVRLVIMLIMVVFDPLAILLLIAANMSMQPQPRQQPDLVLDEPLSEEVIEQAKEVEHLHCSFLYRAGVHDYCLGLSRVAHREETLFTYGLYKKGYKILVIPNAITWHLKNPNGGIRSETNQKLYEQDEYIFRNLLNYKDKTIVVLDCGMGDHIVFSHVMPEITNPEIFTCYPDIVPGRPIAEAYALFGNLEQYNIYRKMAELNWKGSLENAFRKMYV